MLAAKLIATPALIALVFWVEHRFGHAFAGLVAGFPLTSALTAAFLVNEQGAAFARDAAAGMLAGIAILGLYVFVFAHAAARGAPWWLALGVAIAAYLPTTVAASVWPVTFRPAAIMAIVTLAAAAAFMPRRLGQAPARPHGGWELPLRMAVGTALVVVLTAAAQGLGPNSTGLLLLFPAITSVLSAFILQRAGAAAVVRMLRGLALGCFSFVAFFIVIGVALGTMPAVVAFTLAGAAAIGASAVSWRLGVSRVGTGQLALDADG